MLMGMYGVSYDVADVLNGSNLSVEQATEIAARRQQARAYQDQQDFMAAQKQNRAIAKAALKDLTEMNKIHQEIACGIIIVPDEMLDSIVANLKKQIVNLTRISKDPLTSRNFRTAARTAAKHAEAALETLKIQQQDVAEHKKAAEAELAKSQ